MMSMYLTVNKSFYHFLKRDVYVRKCYNLFKHLNLHKSRVLLIIFIHFLILCDLKIKEILKALPPEKNGPKNQEYYEYHHPRTFIF